MGKGKTEQNGSGREDGEGKRERVGNGKSEKGEKKVKRIGMEGEGWKGERKGMGEEGGD